MQFRRIIGRSFSDTAKSIIKQSTVSTCNKVNICEFNKLSHKIDDINNKISSIDTNIMFFQFVLLNSMCIPLLFFVM